MNIFMKELNSDGEIRFLRERLNTRIQAVDRNRVQLA